MKQGVVPATFDEITVIIDEMPERHHLRLCVRRQEGLIRL